MKKLLTVIAVSILSLQMFAADFAIRLMPEYYFPLNSILMNSPAGKIAIEYDPFTNIRGRDSVMIGANAGLVPLMASGLENYYAYEGSGFLGYTFRFSDRFNATLEGYGGMWMVPGKGTEDLDPSKKSDPDAGKKESKKNFGGPLFGGRLGVNYYILPELQLGLFSDFGMLIFIRIIPILKRAILNIYGMPLLKENCISLPQKHLRLWQ